MKHTIGLMYLLDPFNRTSTKHSHKYPRAIDPWATVQNRSEFRMLIIAKIFGGMPRSN